MSYLGIDVGGTKVALRTEGDGQEPVTTSFRWPAGGEVREDLAALADQVGRLYETAPAPAAVGVAMPATLDGAGRVVAWPGRPGWNGLDLRAALAGLFPDSPVRCADDGDLGALAEAAAAHCPDVVYLGVGTGIGGGIVHGGRPFPGPERGSCEVGHLIVDRAGPPCDCGRRGCVQAVASGPATLRRAAELRGREVDFADLLTGLTERQVWAREAVADSCAALAAAVVGLAELAHPQLAVIGGGFAAGVPGFVTQVAERVARLARPGVAPVPVRPAALGGLSSLYGAVRLARDTVPGGLGGPGAVATVDPAGRPAGASA